MLTKDFVAKKLIGQSAIRGQNAWRPQIPDAAGSRFALVPPISRMQVDLAAHLISVHQPDETRAGALVPIKVMLLPRYETVRLGKLLNSERRHGQADEPAIGESRCNWERIGGLARVLHIQLVGSRNESARSGHEICKKGLIQLQQLLL